MDMGREDKMMGGRDFGEWLDRQLHQRRMSMSEAGRRSDISHGRISQVIRGESPGWDLIAAMAKLLDMPLEYVASKAGKWEFRQDPNEHLAARRFAQLPEDKKEVILDLLEHWSARYGRKDD